MSVEVNQRNFPDYCFYKIIEAFDLDKDGVLSDSEIAEIKKLTLTDANTQYQYTSYISNEDGSGGETITSTIYLKSLVGLNYLTALESLDLDLDYVKSVDISQLTNLKIAKINTAANTIDLSNNTLLEVIYVYGQYGTGLTLTLGNFANLRELSLTRANIGEMFDCHGDATIQSISFNSCPGLTTINVSGCLNLTNAYADYMPELRSFNASGCIALCKSSLRDCGQLTSVNFSGCTLIKYVGDFVSSNFQNNDDLTTYINIRNSDNITSFDCSGCTALKYFAYSTFEGGSRLSLETVNLAGCTALQTLNCRHNLITNLDVTGLTSLVYIACNDNCITDLQLGNHPNLKKLYCNDNAIISIDLSRVPIIAALVEDIDPSFNHNMRDSQKLYLRYADDYDNSDGWQKEFEVDEGISVTAATEILDLPDSSLIEGIAINETNFPDAGFRNFLSTHYDNDNDDFLSGREIAVIKYLYIDPGIMSVEGIQHFPYCKYICANNDATITSLDLSNNKLIEEIELKDSNISSIDVTGCTGLRIFSSYGNQFTSIDVSTCSALEQLYSSDDEVNTLIFGNNSNLRTVLCVDSQLQSLDIHTLQNLSHLTCYGNNIKQLDISGCPYLIDIFRSSNDPYLLDIRRNNSKWVGYDNTNSSGAVLSDITVDYNTEILGAKAIISTNPTDVKTSSGETVSYNTTASGIDLLYKWQRRSLVPITSPVKLNDGAIRDVYSDGTIKIDSHDAVSISGDILILLADYKFEYGKTYRVKPNAVPGVAGIAGISLQVWSSRFPPVGFGVLTNDPAENDPNVNVKCDTNSTTGVEFTVSNPNHYFVITLSTQSGVAITEQTLRPTIEEKIENPEGGIIYKDVSYIWTYYPIWTDIDDAATNTLSLTASAENDDTQYRCKVYNGFSEAYTEPAGLSIVLPPTIIQHPQRQVVKNNTSVTFSIEATAKEDSNSYQWQVSTDGGTTWTDAADGGTNGGSISEYTITATKSMDHYLYRCIATNIAGTETSDPAELHVLIEPSISAQPEDLTVETSKTATFHIIAAGDELRYKWQVSADNGVTWNDTDPLGDSFDYSFNAEKSLNGNKYQCVVTNDVGSATSNAASLKVLDAPVILYNPIAVTVRDSNNASFSVSASGDELNYQWQISTDGGANWEDITGETADTYSFTALFAMNGNRYRCKVYNDVKTVYTEPALLTVTIQPSITTQPQDTIIASGSNAVFSVEATDREGAGLAYTWQVKESENGEWIAVSGDAYSGYSTASLTVTASTDIDGNQYRCLIEGGHDSILSESAAIDVVAMPVITGELQNAAIRSGSSLSLTASAAGKYISYQWQTYLNEEWTNIDGAANDTYTIIQENPAESGIGTVMYRYTVTNIAGTVTSPEVTVTVIPSIFITNQPLSAESPAGGVVRFTVGVAGERLRYRWQTRGRSSSAWSNVSSELYDGETTQTLSVFVETALSGNQYRCIITDEYSDDYPSLAQIVTSDAATLTTSSRQVILTQPVDATVAAGDLVSFEVIADDEGYAYQWQISTDDGETWSNIQNNGDSPIYVFTANTDQSGAKFCCVVTSGRWAVISRAATLTVATEPVIESEPQDARVGEDKSAEFHIGASGVELQYQWQISTDGINWTDIPDERAKTDTISVTAAMQADGSRYRCKVYNVAGTVYSRDAVLSVIEKIRILANPEDQVAANGDTVSFSVSVSGYSPSYQWLEKAADTDAWINVQDASAAGMTLNVAANEQSNGKRYRCIITNDAGEETSASALLTVYFKPVFTVQPQGEDVDESSVVSLHAEATGGGVSYQWQSKREGDDNWSNLTIDGSTSDTLPLIAHIAINGIQYRCVATNLAGTTESDPATFHVNITSFCLADGSEIDEGVLPAGYYTFNPNADRKGIVYDIGLFDGANTDWVVVEASSARTFYTNGRKAIKILFHHTEDADLEFYAIRPMLEEGQEAHQWVSPVNVSYAHDAANDFNYGWFSIGNKYGNRENIVTASAPCVMTLRYRPIWKDTL